MDQINQKLEEIAGAMNIFMQRISEHSEKFQQIERFLNHESITAEGAEINDQRSTTNSASMDCFRIPDPIKLLPEFDGNRRQLSAWLETAEQTLELFQGQVTQAQNKIFFNIVKNKVTGRAKDALCVGGNPQTFEEMKHILLKELGDKKELSTYKCQLWQCKMTEFSQISLYYSKMREIVGNIKTLTRQNAHYKDNWEIINRFIEEDALTAFIAGLKEPYFGHVQAANPKSMEDAYAFLCKFKNRQFTSTITNTNGKNTNFSKFTTTHKSYQPFKKASTQNEQMDTSTTRSHLTIKQGNVNNQEAVLGETPNGLETNFQQVMDLNQIT